MILNIKGDERNVSTANTVSNASCVRVYIATGTRVMTVTDASATQLGNTTLGAGQHIVSKHPTDLLTFNSATPCTPIAFNVS